MNVKMFEVRDRRTMIPVIAVRLGHHYDEAYISQETQSEIWLSYQLGFGKGAKKQTEHVMLATTNDRMHWQPYEWNDRTLQAAHDYIRRHFDQLSSGEVVDVEYIMGETDKPKQSERFEYRPR